MKPQISQISQMTKERLDRIANFSIQIGDLQDLVAEVRRCWNRIDELLDANTHEIELRRKAEQLLSAKSAKSAVPPVQP